MHFTVTVPATTANLGPGFDCLGLALALYNTLEVSLREDGLLVSVAGEGQGSLALDETNLMVAAMQRLYAHVGRSMPALHLQQKNCIPVGSGLGSSAAATLAGLLAANHLLGAPLSRMQLLELALDIEGHPDNIAPALLGGLVLASRDEAGLTVQPLPVAGLRPLVVVPTFSLATTAARRALPRQVALEDAVFNAARLGLLLQALAEGDYDGLERAMVDRLHQPYRLPLVPGMAEAVAAARAAGARGVALSGAGPGVVALAEGKHEEIAQAIQGAFDQAGLQSRRWLLDVDRQGSRIS